MHQPNGVLTLDIEDFDSTFEACEALCESPIEHAMLSALWDTWPQDDPLGAALMPQFKAGTFRFDFVISFRTTRDRDAIVVVECDGHDWHDLTKAQARRDRFRDRLVQVSGANILRFTGSEIHEDAYRCASEVWDFVRLKHQQD